MNLGSKNVVLGKRKAPPNPEVPATEVSNTSLLSSIKSSTKSSTISFRNKCDDNEIIDEQLESGMDEENNKENVNDNISDDYSDENDSIVECVSVENKAKNENKYFYCSCYKKDCTILKSEFSYCQVLRCTNEECPNEDDEDYIYFPLCKTYARSKLCNDCETTMKPKKKWKNSVR